MQLRHHRTPRVEAVLAIDALDRGEERRSGIDRRLEERNHQDQRRNIDRMHAAIAQVGVEEYFDENFEEWGEQ